MLDGKVAVITGGTRGIGRAIAEKFASCGADIALIATSDSDAAKETMSALEKRYVHRNWAMQLYMLFRQKGNLQRMSSRFRN